MLGVLNTKFNSNYFAIIFTDGDRLNGQDGIHNSLSVWSPRFMGFPYGSHLQDRSMYSIYGSLLGLNAANVTLPNLSLNPFTPGTLTPTTSLAAGYGLLQAGGPQSNDSTSRSPASVYHSALYGGQRFHPYLPLSTATTVKRPPSATSPSLSIQ